MHVWIIEVFKNKVIQVDVQEIMKNHTENVIVI